MKRRTKRDLGILLGVAVLLGAIVVFNYELRRGSLIEEMTALRKEVEANRISEGYDLLRWETIRETKGKPRTGGTFAEELAQYDGKSVNLIGFMVPNEQFVDVKEFMLLPLPIECYFCELPPARDVMWVQLKEGETTAIYEEPVIINGTLNLHRGEDQKFFYSITEAELGAGEMGGDLHKRDLDPEHMIGGSEHGQEEELLPPVEDPTPAGNDTD